MNKVRFIMIQVTVITISLVVLAIIITSNLGTNSPIQSEKPSLSMEEIVHTVPAPHIVHQNQLSLSPDGKYYAFLSTTDMGMTDSVIWIINVDGSDLRKLVEGDGLRYISSPTWNPSSNKIAYLQIYPFELRTIDIASYEKKLVYSETEVGRHNLLNPGLGYASKASLEWLGADEIMFENNKATPNRLYAVNIETKQERLVEILKPEPNPIVDKDFPHFSQRDKTWGNVQLGGCANQTIHTAGCTITSLAMVINYLDIDINPETFNEFLSAEREQGYVLGCDVRWNIVANYAPGLQLKGVFFNSRSTKRLDYELSLGNPVVVGFNSVPYTSVPHWVVITEKAGDDYLVADPWLTSNKQKLLSEFGTNFNHMAVFAKE